jgi:hypothetical protein
VVKQRDYGVKPSGFRKKGASDFDSELYKQFRGVVEGVFGGLQSRRLLFSRYKSVEMRARHIIAMGLSHNIQVYMKIIFCLVYYVIRYVLGSSKK